MRIRSSFTREGYYSTKPMMSTNADIMMVFGERSNGKTYGFLSECIKEYKRTKRPSLLVRRLAETIRPKNMEILLPDIESILKAYKIPFGNIKVRGKGFYIGYAAGEKNGKQVYTYEEKPFLYLEALNTMETTKGTYGNLHLAYLVFDEFMTRESYLKNEFITFMNLIATAVRDNEEMRVVMLGNTVSTLCPYFREMGIGDIKKLNQGEIYQFEYNNDGGDNLRLSVEYCAESPRKSKQKTSKFFAFNSPELKMITSGKWEIASYPHPDWRTKDDKCYFRNVYAIIDGDTVCIEFRANDIVGEYIMVRPYYRPISDNAAIIYTDQIISDNRFRIAFTNDFIDKTFLYLFRTGHIYYSDNTCGETIRNLIKSMQLVKREML